MELLDRILFENTVRQWLVALGVAAIVYAVLRLILSNEGLRSGSGSPTTRRASSSK